MKISVSKKFTVSLLAVFFAVSAVAAQMPDTRWYVDAIAANPAEADFVISTADELAGLATIVNGTWGGKPAKDAFSGKRITLTADIDLSAYDNWMPIGLSFSDRSFSGIFDGGGHVINNLTINRPSNDMQSLFGVVAAGTIKNLGVENANVVGKDGIGALVGMTRLESRIINCHATGTVRGGWIVGGLVGNLASGVDNGRKIRYDCRVINSYFDGTVSGVNGVGGISGSVFAGSVINSYSAGTVSGSTMVGGLTGRIDAQGIMTNSYSTSLVSGDHRVGGVTGYASYAEVTNCAALNPEVKGRTNVGRVVGEFGAVSENNTVDPGTRNNAAYSGMIINNNGNTAAAPVNKGADNWDGADITECEINLDGTIAGLFTDTGGWTVKNGRLPGFGRTTAMPPHLRAQSHADCVVPPDTTGNDTSVVVVVPPDTTGNDTSVVIVVPPDTTGNDTSVVIVVPPDTTGNDTSVVIVVPPDTTGNDTAVVDSTKEFKGRLTVGPNPVCRRSGPLKFYREGERINDAVLTIYDAFGNVVNHVRISDNAGNQDKRLVGSWNLMDARGRPASEGTYLVRGAVVTIDGRRERVSVVFGVW